MFPGLGMLNDWYTLLMRNWTMGRVLQKWQKLLLDVERLHGPWAHVFLHWMAVHMGNGNFHVTVEFMYRRYRDNHLDLETSAWDRDSRLEAEKVLKHYEFALHCLKTDQQRCQTAVMQLMRLPVEVVTLIMEEEFNGEAVIARLRVAQTARIFAAWKTLA